MKLVEDRRNPKENSEKLIKKTTEKQLTRQTQYWASPVAQRQWPDLLTSRSWRDPI